MLDKIQINNLKQRAGLTKKKNSEKEENLNMNEIVEWCQANSAIPDDWDTPFVVRLDFSNDLSQENLRIFGTTKRLLYSATYNTDLLATDATQKLMYEKFSLILVGTVDKCKLFHPYGIMMTSTEQERDFTGLFKSLKSLLHEINKIEYEPTALIADPSEAIPNGFKNVFKQLKTRIVCWIHVKDQIKSKLKRFKDKVFVQEK